MSSIARKRSKIGCAVVLAALGLSLGGCVYAPPPAPAAYYDPAGGYYPGYAYAPGYYPYDYTYPYDYGYGAPIYGGIYFGGRGRFR